MDDNLVHLSSSLPEASARTAPATSGYAPGDGQRDAPHRRRRPRCWNALPASRRETLDFPRSATIGDQFCDRSYG